MFSSEPILTFANRFEPTDQSALSNRAYLSAEGVRKCFTLDTPVKPTAQQNARFVERFCRARRRVVHTPTHDQSPPLSAAQPACHNSRLPSSPSAIVAQSSSSGKKPLKRSMTPRGREMAAKKAKGIERKLPWSWSAGGAGSASWGGGGVACAAAWGAVEAEGARAPPPERVEVPISAQRTVGNRRASVPSVHRFPRR